MGYAMAFAGTMWEAKYRVGDAGQEIVIPDVVSVKWFLKRALLDYEGQTPVPDRITLYGFLRTYDPFIAITLIDLTPIGFVDTGQMPNLIVRWKVAGLNGGFVYRKTTFKFVTFGADLSAFASQTHSETLPALDQGRSPVNSISFRGLWDPTYLARNFIETVADAGPTA